jgi:uncharacterized membrane protein (UPF0127 family)
MDTQEWAQAMRAVSHPFPVSEVVVRCDGAVGDAPGRLLRVLEASTPEQRRLGLMFRDRSELQQDGMLFRYPSDVTAAFSMNNTWMPLRIYWFNSEGACVGSADLEAMSSKQVPSPRPFRYALEVPMDRTLGSNPSLIL